jgi:hypothetical protein
VFACNRPILLVSTLMNWIIIIVAAAVPATTTSYKLFDFLSPCLPKKEHGSPSLRQTLMMTEREGLQFSTGSKPQMGEERHGIPHIHIVILDMRGGEVWKRIMKIICGARMPHALEPSNKCRKVVTPQLHTASALFTWKSSKYLLDSRSGGLRGWSASNNKETGPCPF